MSYSKDVTEFFDLSAKILLRCFALGYALILIWVALSLLAPGFIITVGKWFDLAPHEAIVINYCCLPLVKILVLLFFLIPYGAIRWALKTAGR